MSVAQSDRVLASDAKGCGFDPRRTRHFFERILMYQDLLIKAEQEHNLEISEILYLLSTQEAENDILSAADRVRKKYIGDKIYLRGLIEFSNICKNNCLYCGIRKDNNNIHRYRLDEEQIISMAKKAQSLGIQTVVLQSGEDLWFNTQRMCSIISKIKEFDMVVTLSIGEKSFDEYKAYRQAGADRYLLRIETTDKDLYHKLDPNMTWDNRKHCLDDLRELGYEVGSGTMVGLPEQSLLSIAQDIAFFKAMDLDMVGIGPFIPHPDTPLKNAKGNAFILSLKVMALTRLLLPEINIPATTAMETLHPNGRIIALQSGANVLMPNIASTDIIQDYNLYPGKAFSQIKADEISAFRSGSLASIGRRISFEKGTSLHKLNKKHKIFS